MSTLRTVNYSNTNICGETTYYQAIEKSKNKWEVTITVQDPTLTHPSENLGVFTTQQIAQAFRWNPEVIRR